MKNNPSSDSNIEKINMTIIKELSSGANGTAYLVERGGVKMVYKIEKMDVFDENTPLQSEYYRQVDFNKNIAIEHPNNFLVLKSHGIIYDCEYVHPKTEEFEKSIDENRKRIFKRKNTQSDCYFLLYTPFLDGSYREIRKIIYQDPKLFIDFIYQIINSINIMRKKGYSHNDLHSNNLMYKKINDGYQWYIIDYGSVYHEKFPISEMDKDIRELTLYSMDLVNFINMCIDKNLIDFIHDHNIIQLPLNDFIKNLKNEPEYNKIIKYIPTLIVKEEIYNKFTIQITKILFPKIYLKCIGAPKELYEKYENKQLYPKILLYCLKHCFDETYDNILQKIKAYKYTNGGYQKKYHKYKLKYLSLK